MSRFWLAIDVPTAEDRNAVYALFDILDAEECTESVVEFESDKGWNGVKEQVLKQLPKGSKAYLIEEGGKAEFILGRRKSKPYWKDLAASIQVTEDDL